MDSPFTILKSDLHPKSPTRQVICRYDITLIYEGETNTCGNGLQRAAISARLLLDGKTLQDVEQSKVIVNEGPTSRIRWKLGGYFATQPTLSSFAIYVSLKSPKQERTILEAKFHQQFIQASQGGYTWDIVASKFLDDGFSLSLETHHFHPSHDRVDIFHETKTRTTFLYMNPSSDDRDASPEREKQLVQNLLDLPSSETRALVLLVNGFHLISRHRHTSNVIYCDLAIQAISAACAHSGSIRRQPEINLCQFLFFRCTQPDGHLFLDKAMDVLKGLDSVPLAEAAMQEIPFLWSILHVLQEQNRSDYTAIALPVLIPSLRVLAAEHRTNPKVVPILRRALLLSFKLPKNMNETLTLLDINLPLVALHYPGDYSVYLMFRATNYILHNKNRGEPDRDSVIVAIGEAQTYLLQHGKPNDTQNVLTTFLKAARAFLILLPLEPRLDISQHRPTRMCSILSILGVVYGVDEDEPLCRLAFLQFLDLLLKFRHRPSKWHPVIAQNIKEFIQAIYAEQIALGDSDVDFLKDLMLCQVQSNIAICFEAPRPQIHAAIKYSLSTDPPRNEVALMRAMVAAPAARLYELPITLRAYQLLMAAHEMWTPIYVPLHLRQTTYRFGTFMVHDAISPRVG
ncbi:hypothetical protein BDN72DRAFT_905843 [Pluteus cervinus]|uniref:Uncharacterized protein n=1 Tax=Pluteus cervinus TaxID=181527 RepID=A0ACD3A236_9AGAR|nr:hypothetical protein BDN72DRAFT_905843 [Pluteus cervinus]